MNGFILKCIALITMMIDHTGVVLQPLFSTMILRCVGRAAFPIYAFFVAEGCRKTRSMGRYALRLSLFAILSEIPFDMVLLNVKYRTEWPSILFFDFSDQNIFCTLLLGALAVWLVQIFRQKGWPLFMALILDLLVISLGAFGKTDYGAAGVLFILLLYLAPNKPIQALCVAVMSFYFYILSWINWGGSDLWPQIMTAFTGLSFYNRALFAGGCVSAVLICFYNGKRGPRAKWFFYAAYPVHLLILLGVWFFVVSPRLR
ncbi:MAG: conjugal transfer protein TraX [Clostridiales bacterium]|jgi:hypothetical protein|nr:conjugal transfer protein TraX [Clostridiales bacterium]